MIGVVTSCAEPDLWWQHGADLPVQIVNVSQSRLVASDLGLVGSESDLEGAVKIHT